MVPPPSAASQGNKKEEIPPLVWATGFAVPVIIVNVYFLQWQTFVSVVASRLRIGCPAYARWLQDWLIACRLTRSDAAFGPQAQN